MTDHRPETPLAEEQLAAPHADQHGAVHIPHEIAPRAGEAAQAVEVRERVTINFCQLDEFSAEGLN